MNSHLFKRNLGNTVEGKIPRKCGGMHIELCLAFVIGCGLVFAIKINLFELAQMVFSNLNSTQEIAMTKQQTKTKDHVKSAPESGTVRDKTSGNKPSDRSNLKTKTDKSHSKSKARRDPRNPASGQEEI